MSQQLKYLAAYPAELQLQVQKLLDNHQLADLLLNKYPHCHSVKTNRTLYDYVMGLKNQYLKKAERLSKIEFDPRIHVIHNALGTHRYISRVQGAKLKSKNEIRVSTLFKNVPEPFLNMIVVHELAHLKEKEHNKAFYQMCCHMMPDYHQVEFDLRIHLSLKERGHDVYAKNH